MSGWPGELRSPAVDGCGVPAPPATLVWRVDRRELFVALRSARRGRSGPLTVSCVPGDPTKPPRVAYAISKKVGTAVERNRVRRRLRALVRQQVPPPGAYLIGAGAAAVGSSSEELGRDLRSALARSREAAGSPREVSR